MGDAERKSPERTPDDDEALPYIPKSPPEPESAYPYNAGSPWSPFLAPVSLTGCYGLIWLLAIILIVVVVVSVVF
jgi:hypothetical protein